eukprot:1161639-Pelagomonas_calceolata.AAC.10
MQSCAPGSDLSACGVAVAHGQGKAALQLHLRFKQCRPEQCLSCKPMCAPIKHLTLYMAQGCPLAMFCTKMPGESSLLHLRQAAAVPNGSTSSTSGKEHQQVQYAALEAWAAAIDL